MSYSEFQANQEMTKEEIQRQMKDIKLAQKHQATLARNKVLSSKLRMNSIKYKEHTPLTLGKILKYTIVITVAVIVITKSI